MSVAQIGPAIACPMSTTVTSESGMAGESRVVAKYVPVGGRRGARGGRTAGGDGDGAVPASPGRGAPDDFCAPGSFDGAWQTGPTSTDSAGSG